VRESWQLELSYKFWFHAAENRGTIILQVQQPIPVLSGTVAPWFGQMGGGMQYVLNSSVQELINAGALAIVGS